MVHEGVLGDVVLVHVELVASLSDEVDDLEVILSARAGQGGREEK